MMKICKRKSLILIICIFLLFIMLYFVYIHLTPKVHFIDTENYFDKKAMIEFSEELDRISKQADYKGDIDVYTGNFITNDIPDIRDLNHTNILLMGSMSNVELSKVSKFNFIFVSTLDLQEYLKLNDIKSFYIPLFVKSTKKINPSKCVFNYKSSDCYWLVVGNQPEIIEYLKVKNIRFQHYPTFDKNFASTFNDYSNLSGIFVNEEYTYVDSLDISPFWIKIIQYHIPLFVFNSIEFASQLIPLFNNTIPAYSSPNGISFDKISDFNSALAIIDNYMVAPAAAQRVFDTIKNDKSAFPSINDFVTAWTVSAVFSYNSFGDYTIADDLLDGLKSYVRYTSATFPWSVFNSFGEVNIYFRGISPLPKPSGISLVYFLYPSFNPNLSVNQKNLIQSFEEFTPFDAVVTASYSVYEKLKKLGFQAYYVPQFTNVKKFYPDYDERVKSEVLFVGNKYFDRIAVPILMKNKINVDVYGNFWPEGVAKDYLVDNRILRKYYSSAKIVLNDTRTDMRELGFISNRIFDATACETLVISDYMKEIEDVYGDSVPMWKTEEELVKLVKYYIDPAHEAERREKAKRAREITLQNFTSDIAASKFMKIINEVKKRKGLE